MGDLTDALAIPLFEAIAPFDCVAGNNDPDEIWARFGRRKVLTIDGVRIGSYMVTWAAATLTRTPSRHLPMTRDVILYGHSHRPIVEQRGAQLVANPGSRPIAA